MTERHSIVPQGMEAIYQTSHFSPAVKVGNLVFVSGQVGRDVARNEIVDGAAAQIEQAFANLRQVLAAAGASFADVVEIVTYHVAIDQQLAEFRAIKDRYFPSNYPAWTAIGVASLAHPKMVFEIKCTAVLA
jgi:enamine deaminase RidA (YjgF/YER057c/UK114 family)